MKTLYPIKIKNMKIIKNLTDWKTTLIGVLLIAADIAYLLLTAADYIIFFGTLSTSLALLFMPDTFLSALKSLINKNKNKEL